MVRANRRACSRSVMKAPRPHFTSSTSAPIPSATFLEMIEAAIRGGEGTVPVTSRRA